MKKLILSIFILFVSLLPLVIFPSPSNAQAEPDCRKIFDKESYKCLTDFNDCQAACSEKTKKPDGSIYFNSGEIFSKCTKESNCSGKSSACSEQALASYRLCVKSGKQPAASEAKQETPKQEAKSGNTVNDWILENALIYEPSIAALNETPLKNREPLIKQGQPNTSSAIRRVAESSLIPGARISNYAEGVMVEISKGGWVYIPPSGEVIYGTQEWRRYFDIMMGTVEVETNENSTEVKTPNTTINTKGTHYWVSYDTNKKETTVGVYEGKVEVKTKDGKATTVSPDGDKPGVVVVSQKLSLVKLAIVGAILAAILGGIVWFVKRKKRK